MSKDAVDSSWMDERDPELKLGLTCDVNLTIESGDTYREILAEAARALRTTALQIEEGKLEDGFHPVKTLSGEEIGEVYLDYYGIGER
jgi:hypothetical protein